jgi:hypothetical protein
MQRAIPYPVLATLAVCSDDSSLSIDPQGEVPRSIPVNGRIYFAANITGQLDLYSMKPEGTDRRRITFPWT